MLPRSPVANPPYRVQRHAIGIGYGRQRLAGLSARQDHRDIGLRHLGVDISRPSLSAFRMFAGAIGIASCQKMRIAPCWVGFTRQQTPLGSGISDILALCAKAQMCRVAARRIIASMENAEACWTQLRLVGKRRAGRELIGYAMRAALLPVPFYGAVAMLVSARSYKWPTGLRGADCYTLPKALGVNIHSASLTRARDANLC